MLNGFQISIGAVSVGEEFYGDFVHVDCAPTGEPVELWSNYSIDEFQSGKQDGSGIDCTECGGEIRPAYCVECGFEDVTWSDDANRGDGAYLCSEHVGPNLGGD